MKKLALALLPSLLFVACTHMDKPLTKENFVGEWICTTEYPRVHVGTVDVMTFNADGSLKNDSYIFDHSIHALLGQGIDNYFKSPFKYLKINYGNWNVSEDTLTLDLKTQNTKRIIFKDVWEKIQEKDNLIKKTEAELFKIYSSEPDSKIQLVFDKFIKDGFILSQNISGDTYKSECMRKDVSKYKYVEKYKKMQEMK